MDFELAGRPLLCWLADKAMQVADEVLVAVPADRVDATAALLPGCDGRRGDAAGEHCRAGGAGARRRLLLHEAAPIRQPALFRQVIDKARQCGCAGAFLSPAVPVARLRDGRVVEAYAGSEVGIFQTPQVYARADMDRMLQLRDAMPCRAGTRSRRCNGRWLPASTCTRCRARRTTSRSPPAKTGEIAQHLGHLLA